MFKSPEGSIRPFSQSAGVKCRGYSLALQRVMTDFGSEESFSHAAERVEEHYGIEVPVSTLAVTTERHAQKVFADETIKDEVSNRPGKKLIIAETDGSMVPIVETDNTAVCDKRTTRKVKWKEARVCMVREHNKVNPTFRAVMGSVDKVGDLLLDGALAVGMGSKTKIHGIGDGAIWIKNQFDRVFSTQSSFLIDFYHVCDYLVLAAKKMSVNHGNDWLNKSKERLKTNQHEAVLSELEDHLEHKDRSDEGLP